MKVLSDYFDLRKAVLRWETGRPGPGVHLLDWFISTAAGMFTVTAAEQTEFAASGYSLDE